MRERPPKPPPARSATARSAILEALLATREANAAATGRELGAAASISEKDVAAHLEHLARSLPHEALKLAVTPASCLACEYTFQDRGRYTTPGACPKCRSERVAPPSFRVTDGPRAAKRERPRDEE